MVFRVCTMVEANLRSSSRRRMSAMEWKMFSAFRSRQSCLCAAQETKTDRGGMVNERGTPTRAHAPHPSCTELHGWQTGTPGAATGPPAAGPSSLFQAEGFSADVSWGRNVLLSEPGHPGVKHLRAETQNQIFSRLCLDFGLSCFAPRSRAPRLRTPGPLPAALGALRLSVSCGTGRWHRHPRCGGAGQGAMAPAANSWLQPPCSPRGQRPPARGAPGSRDTKSPCGCFRRG